MDKLIGYITDKRYLQHDTGLRHPESPQRLIAINNCIKTSKLDLMQIKPRLATNQELLLAHTKEYIQLVKEETNLGQTELTTGDTAICPESFTIAKLAAGGVLAACDAVMENKINYAFCAIRPPGHHAESNKGMGFCIFNNVALAAKYLQQKYHLKRILIVDWDLHHGNGTQEIFYADNSVLYFSTHQEHNYPGTGADNETGIDAGVGFTLNVNLPIGSGDDIIITAFETKLVPKADEFKPEFVLISAGFDGHKNDPLGMLTITDAGFAKLTQIVKTIAQKHCQGKIVSILEGGYNPTDLANVVIRHIKTLIIELNT